MENVPANKKIILFDGVCNLCNSAVQFVIARDKKDIFRFVALQSALGQKMIKHIGTDASKMDSIILYETGFAYYHKSEAVFEIAKNLGGIFNFVTLFSILPASITNSIYDFIAKNRYKWFGKKENCMIPTKELLAKFLE